MISSASCFARPGVPVHQWRSQAAFYAGNSLSTTLPGGPVLSATFIYRQQRRWGATPVIASWQLVMSGALQVISLTLLGLGSAFFLGAKHNPFSLIFTLAGFIMLILLAQAVASRPDLLDGVGVRVLSWVNYLRAKPPDNGPGQMARDAGSTRIGQPDPTPAGRRIRMVDDDARHRCGNTVVRLLRRGRASRHCSAWSSPMWPPGPSGRSR